MTIKKHALLFISLIVVSFSACTKWTYDDPNMPEGFREYHEGLLQDNIEKLKSNENDRTVLFDIGLEYQILGDYKNAVYFYNKVLEQDEKDSVVLNNMASIYEKMENYSEAAKYIKRLYEIDTGNIETIKDTIRILVKAEELGSAQEALDNFSKVVGTANEDINALIKDLQASIDNAKK